MKQFLFVTALSFALFSCKKDPQETPAPASPNNPAAAATLDNCTMLHIGNYWIYDTYRIDTSGNETFLRTDSTYVKCDSVLNGNTYKFVQGGVLTGFYRDSSGYLVNERGDILFNVNTSGVPYYNDTINGWGHYDIRTNSTQPTITVPAGTFTNTYDNQFSAYAAPSVNYPYGNPRSNHYYYAQNYGAVKLHYFMSAYSYDEESRLVRYHVQ